MPIKVLKSIIRNMNNSCNNNFDKNLKSKESKINNTTLSRQLLQRPTNSYAIKAMAASSKIVNLLQNKICNNEKFVVNVRMKQKVKFISIINLLIYLITL